MTATLIGYRRSDYVSKRDGLRKTGYNFYFERSAPQVEGLATESVYFSDDKLYGFTPAVGLVVDYETNRYGSGCFIRESIK